MIRRYTTLSQRLGAEDRHRLQQHLERIRELEQRMASMACTGPVLVDTSDYNPTAGLLVEENGNSSDPVTDAAIPKVGMLMMDMLVMALSCNLTSVATLLWSDTEAIHTLPWLGLNEDVHFYMNNGGYHPEEMTTIYTWYSTQHVRAVVEVVLQGPDLLYLIEQGTSESQGDVVALSSHETAARLAYFLTGHPPDAELAAAASGSLSEEALEGQARRLLGSPPSRRLTRSFMEDLLGLDPPGRDEGLQHPNFATASALEETGLFVESVTFDGAGTFEALFSEPTTWVNSALAQFYGLSTTPGAEFERVELDAGQRAGVLTQAAFLSAHSRVEQTSPVQRAVAVLNRVLCRELPWGRVTHPAP